jgi:3-oxoacyl-[acyl-carrier protein] reductase
VRVNVVAPGTIDEPGGWMESLRTEDPERVRSLEESIPAGRFGTPQEVASCIAYLLSDSASWIVGHCLVADGGQFPGIR